MSDAEDLVADRIEQAIALEFEGQGEAWSDRLSGDRLARYARRAVEPITDALVAKVESLTTQLQAARTQNDRLVTRVDAALSDRDALATQLRAVQAVIAEAKHYLETERWDDPTFDPIAILSRSDTSADPLAANA